jgi:hypothetical protein
MELKFGYDSQIESIDWFLWGRERQNDIMNSRGCCAVLWVGCAVFATNFRLFI